MSMPTIPEGINRPTFDQVVIDLLESIALEEIAISHILNTEGEKLQELVHQFGCENICFTKLCEGCRSSETMVNSLIMKEWLLLNKLDSIFSLMANKDCFETSQNSPINRQPVDRNRGCNTRN